MSVTGEEVIQPEIRIPRSIVYGYLVGWVVAFVFAIIMLFFMGDPNVAMNTPAGWVSERGESYFSILTSDAAS